MSKPGGVVVGKVDTVYSDQTSSETGPVENASRTLDVVTATHKITGEVVDITNDFEIVDGTLKFKDDRWFELEGGIDAYEIDAVMSIGGTAGSHEYEFQVGPSGSRKEISQFAFEPIQFKIDVDHALTSDAKRFAAIDPNRIEGTIATTDPETGLITYTSSWDSDEIPEYRTDNLLRENRSDVTEGWDGQNSVAVGFQQSVQAQASEEDYDTETKNVHLVLQLEGDASIEDESGGDYLGRLSMSYVSESDSSDGGSVTNDTFAIDQVIATRVNDDGTTTTLDLTNEFELTANNELKLKDNHWLETSEGEGLSDYSLEVTVTASGNVGDEVLSKPNGENYGSYYGGYGSAAQSLTTVDYEIEPTTFTIHINPSADQATALGIPVPTYDELALTAWPKWQTPLAT